MPAAEAPRIPRTLWLQVLKDMWRLILLTALVLTTILAFALSIKPLADGLLSPLQCLKLIGLSMLPALYYALPFSACFGATLAYYRLASDNELTAAHAGGISHKTILAPVVITGLVLACAMWFLANWQIPRFLRYAAEVVTQNATQVIETTIRQGQALRQKIDGKPTYIYADAVRRFEAAGSGDAAATEAPGRNRYDTLWLQGILFVTMDDEGRVQSQGTAREARLWVAREASTGPDGSPSVEVVIQPEAFVGIQTGGRAEGGSAVQSFRIPNAFRDDPKFMTLPELVRLQASPERLSQVDERRRRLAALFAEEEITQHTIALLKRDGVAPFADGTGTRYFLRARDLKRMASADGWYRILPGAEEVIMIERASPQGAPLNPLRAQGGQFRVISRSDPITGQDKVTVEMRFQQVLGVRSEWERADLMPVGIDVSRVLAEPSESLIRATEAKIAAFKSEERARPLAEAVFALKKRTGNMLREVLSKHHERLAMSVACLVMVMTGAVMAMKLRDKLPLTIYLWAFVPALVAVLTISTGQQLTHQHGWYGVPVLWLGVGVLAAYTLYQFRIMARN